jgi:ureidoglycolate lyase
MALIIDSPLDVTIEVQDLTQKFFSEFGVVIENPQPQLEPSANIEQLPPNVIRANQGTALKYQNVTKMLDLYSSAPSGVTSRAVMNMFVCAPRALQQSENPSLHGIFPVEILERHPFTTQTFIPVGLSKIEKEGPRYLVIVAPSLSPSCADRMLPVPAQNLAARPPGRGLPDLTRLKAFIADGSQAITYGAGTWHAPMVVIGTRHVDFLVVQFANGVESEDCQEVIIQCHVGNKIHVAITSKQVHGSMKL